MTLPELMNALNATQARLSLVNGKLHVDAPAGAMTTEMRSSLAEHRETLIAALTVPESSFPATVGALSTANGSDQNFSVALLGWLEYLAAEYECGTVYGEHGRTWHVRATVGRLLFADTNDRWIEEASDFYTAMIAARPSVLTLRDVQDLERLRTLNEVDTKQLQAILIEFADAMESADQRRVDSVWKRLNDFNVRTGRAKPSNPPRVLTGEGAIVSSATHDLQPSKQAFSRVGLFS